MRLIVQRDEEGCGIACVAMLKGISYAAARRLMFGNNKVKHTQTRDLVSALKCLGLMPQKKQLTSFGKRYARYSELPENAILKANPRKGGRYWHWIVWDVRRKKLLDPLPTEDRYLHPKPISFLIVETS
jgi:hypothetical protein